MNRPSTSLDRTNVLTWLSVLTISLLFVTGVLRLLFF